MSGNGQIAGRVQDARKHYDVAALLKAGYFLSPALMVYGRAGVALGKFDTNIRLGDGRTFQQDDFSPGFRAGVGAEYSFPNNLFMLLDYSYTRYNSYHVDRSSPGQIASGMLKIENFTPVENVFSVGLGYRFGGSGKDDKKAAAPRLQRGPDGKGVRLGSFIFQPSLTVSETYDSNIFATRTGSIGDYVTTISPGFTLNSDWKEHELDFSGSADVLRYGQNETEDHEHYSFATDGRYDIARATNAFGGASYTKGVEDRESPDNVSGSAPTEYTDIRGYFGGFHRFGRPAVRVGGTVRSLDFNDTPATGGSINNDDRDRMIYTGGVWTGYQIAQPLELWGQAAADVRRYRQSVDDFGFARDSTGYRALVGADFKLLGGSVDGSIYAGSLYQAYNDARFQSISVPSFGGNLTWSISPSTEASVFVDRVLTETTLPSASGSIDTTYGGSISQQITAKLRGDAQFAFTNSDFYGISREDNLVSASIGVRYNLTKEFFLGADYRYEARQSEVFAQNYQRSQISLRIGSEF